MINDHIADMLTRIKNAYAVGKKDVTLPHTKMCESVARTMLAEKYLASVAVEEGSLKLGLLYVSGKPSLTSVSRVSRPGVRIYTEIASLKPVLSGLGIAILSTSRGVMSSREAKKQHLGGEVLAKLW